MGVLGKICYHARGAIWSLVPRKAIYSSWSFITTLSGIVFAEQFSIPGVSTNIDERNATNQKVICILAS